jgi:adenylate cyclase
MESGESELPAEPEPAADTPGVDGREAAETGLASSSGSEERAARVRRLAVRVDSHSSLLTVARRLRRRLPGDDQFGDPLSTAGRQPVEVLGRGISALQSDRKSVLQELGFAGLQVWQSLSEATGRGRGDRQMAVMFTDLVGFSSWALKAGDEPALELLRRVGACVEMIIGKHDGRIVKRLGDGVMATVLSARAAVDAALDAQAQVGEIESTATRCWPASRPTTCARPLQAAARRRSAAGPARDPHQPRLTACSFRCMRAR